MVMMQPVLWMTGTVFAVLLGYAVFAMLNLAYAHRDPERRIRTWTVGHLPWGLRSPLAQSLRWLAHTLGANGEPKKRELPEQLKKWARKQGRSPRVSEV